MYKRKGAEKVSKDKGKYTINMKEVVEPGDFSIMIGLSSQTHSTIKLTVVK